MEKICNRNISAGIRLRLESIKLLENVGAMQW